MNRFSVIGRLTRDPELKELDNGSKVVNITLAVDRKYKDKKGKKITDYIPFTIWGKNAENICNISKKGACVNFEGTLKTKEIDVNGDKTIIPCLDVESYTHLIAAKDSLNEIQKKIVSEGMAMV